jgi:uncharacterized membrane protein
MISDKQTPKTSSSRLDWLIAALLPSFFLVTSLYIASKRMFWFDEIATVEIARLPDISAIWNALVSGWDLPPVSYYLTVRISESLFGRGEMAARLPCALGMAVGMYLTFLCTKRFSDRLHGLIAQAILGCSYLLYYSYETRPYGLFFMFSTILFCVWSSFDETSNWGAIWFGLVFLVATSGLQRPHSSCVLGSVGSV